MYGRADQDYRATSVAGLSECELFKKGLHGVVVHFQRAVNTAGATRAAHLAKADELLGFLGRLADPETGLGQALSTVYIGMQRMVAAALADTTEEFAETMQNALTQARELETTIVCKIGGRL